MKIVTSIMRKLNLVLTKILDDILIINQKRNQFEQGAICYFFFKLGGGGGFDQQKQIFVTGSMCGTKFQRNECITSPGKQGQNYFAMSRLFKTRIALYGT